MKSIQHFLKLLLYRHSLKLKQIIIYQIKWIFLLEYSNHSITLNGYYFCFQFYTILFAKLSLVLSASQVRHLSIRIFFKFINTCNDLRFCPVIVNMLLNTNILDPVALFCPFISSFSFFKQMQFSFYLFTSWSARRYRSRDNNHKWTLNLYVITLGRRIYTKNLQKINLGPCELPAWFPTASGTL